MKVCGQPHASADFPLGKNLLAPVEKVGWAPQQVWTFLRVETSLVPAENRASIPWLYTRGLASVPVLVQLP
jgi:hypothetical protein